MGCGHFVKLSLFFFLAAGSISAAPTGGNVSMRILAVASEETLDILAADILSQGGYIIRMDSAQGILRVRTPMSPAELSAALKRWDIVEKSESINDQAEKLVQLRADLKSREEHVQRLAKLFEQADFSQTVEIEREYAAAIEALERTVTDLRRVEEENSTTIVEIVIGATAAERTTAKSEFEWMTRKGVGAIYESMKEE